MVSRSFHFSSRVVSSQEVSQTVIDLYIRRSKVALVNSKTFFCFNTHFAPRHPIRVCVCACVCEHMCAYMKTRLFVRLTVTVGYLRLISRAMMSRRIHSQSDAPDRASMFSDLYRRWTSGRFTSRYIDWSVGRSFAWLSKYKIQSMESRSGFESLPCDHR